MGVAVERACREDGGQQGGAERGSRLALGPGVAVTWKKSSWSAHNGNCVEVAALPARSIGVRDSKDTASPILIFDHGAWRQFLLNVKNGRHGLS
jgi:hypothetical protein